MFARLRMASAEVLAHQIDTGLEGVQRRAERDARLKGFRFHCGFSVSLAVSAETCTSMALLYGLGACRATE